MYFLYTHLLHKNFNTDFARLQLKIFIEDFVLINCLFAFVILTKNADLEKYKYTSYGIGWWRR